MIRITKEIDIPAVDVAIEVDASDFDDDELIEEIVSRNITMEAVIRIDEQADDWEFTRRIRDWAVAEMEKHETIGQSDVLDRMERAETLAKVRNVRA